MLIDVAISGDRNVIKKEAEKILNYNRNTAHVECKNKGDTSNNRGDWDYFKVIQKIHTRKTRSQGTQKTVILGTAHILRKVLMYKYNRFNPETNDISSMNSNNNSCNTVFPRDIICLRNISINTLHKGDDDDDDDDDNNNNNNNSVTNNHKNHNKNDSIKVS